MPSASLIADDPNLLLVNAGMVPFKPFFLGEITPPYSRATSVQKCVRTLDIDEVGKTTRHASFFQMCGNFSFGDYFKEGAIKLAWELLTKPVANGGYGLPEEKLWVTVYLDDDEAIDIWHKVIGLPLERIQRRGMADNFWSMGIPGPCGPCSEIYYDRGPEYGKDGGPVADEDRYLEVWNLVFMQNIRGEGGGKENFPIVGDLPAKNIDTGLGLERMAALLQGVENIYEIDTTAKILNKATLLTGVKYGAAAKSDVSLRVIADHARTAMMLIGDGVTPGNEGRGYVLRRMMRRTIRNMRILGGPDKVIDELIVSAIDAMGPQYPNVIEDQERILGIANAEEDSFLQTLKSGTQIFDLAVSDTKQSALNEISGDTVFKLHDTYGFPFDLTLEMANENGLKIDEEGFRRLMREQKDRAKADARAKKSGHADLSEYRRFLDQYGKTKFLGYNQVDGESSIQGILKDGIPVKELSTGNDCEIILGATPFYAEGGGQLPDGGKITLDNGAIVEIDDVQQPIPGLFIHRGEVIKGSVELGQKAFAQIDIERRFAISRAHTATHMVHKAFREALGESATQAGSENSPGRFRFDFSSVQAVSPATLSEVEERVNTLLLNNYPVTAKEMNQAEAKAMGAMALFGEKYGDVVRVVSVGDWAHELCGGTHVKTSGELGVIKLLSESSIGSGVRRVEALVGQDAYKFLAREHLIVESISRLVKGVRPEELPGKINSLLENLKNAEKEITAFRQDKALSAAKELLEKRKKISTIEFVVGKVPDNLSNDDLRVIALELRNKMKDGIVVLFSKGEKQCSAVAALSPAPVEKGLKAGEIIKLASTILGGGGGGKPDFAQGGGPAQEKITEAIGAVGHLIEDLLSKR